MKKTLTTLSTLLLLFLAATTIACATDKTIKKTDKPVTQNFNLKDFTVIDCDVPVNIHYTQAKTYAVRLTSNVNWQPTISVSGKTLHVTRIKDGNTINLPTNTTIDLYVSSPELYTVNLTSATTFTSSKIQNERLKISTAGATTVNIDAINCGTFVLDTRGSSDINIGNITATKGDITIAGSGDIDIDNVECTNLKTDIAGSCDFDLKKATAGLLYIDAKGSIDATVNATAKTFVYNGSGATSGKLYIKADKGTVTIAGSGDADLTFHGGTLNLSTSGPADIDANVTVNTINAECHGPSDITLEGTANTVNLSGNKDCIDTDKLRRK